MLRDLVVTLHKITTFTAVTSYATQSPVIAGLWNVAVLGRWFHTYLCLGVVVLRLLWFISFLHRNAGMLRRSLVPHSQIGARQSDTISTLGTFGCIIQGEQKVPMHLRQKGAT